MSILPEDEFYAASDALGKAIAALPASEKELIRNSMTKSRTSPCRKKSKGFTWTKPPFFAAGLICHPDRQQRSRREGRREPDRKRLAVC